MGEAKRVAERLLYRGPTQPVTIEGQSRVLVTGTLYDDLPAGDAAVVRLIGVRALKRPRQAAPTKAALPSKATKGAN